MATPQADIEAIALAAHILKELKLTGNVTLELNSLGDIESRTAYRDELVKYFSARTRELSADSRDRLTRNPRVPERRIGVVGDPDHQAGERLEPTYRSRSERRKSGSGGSGANLSSARHA